MKTNIQLQTLIHHLKKCSSDQKVNIWKAIALQFEKPTNNTRIVNLYKLNKYAEENETILVPGKVLGVGDVDHKITVAAFKFSESAREKLTQQKCTVYSIEELMHKNPKGNNVRIIG